MESLAGKVALVSGAQQGIGQAIAIAMARAGACVVANWLDDESGVRQVAETAGPGAVIECVQGSVTDPSAIRRMVAAGDALGGVDFLVNNAAVFPRHAFLDMCEEDFSSVLDVNLMGTFRCARAVLPGMVERGRGGVVLNLASVAVERGLLNATHYIASKGAVVGLTRALALEMAPHGIRVNAIAPGLTDTAQPRAEFSEEALQAAGRALPLGRLATVEDIAAMALFLCGEGGSHMTGQTVHVNGGQHLT